MWFINESNTKIAQVSSIFIVEMGVQVVIKASCMDGSDMTLWTCKEGDHPIDLLLHLYDDIDKYPNRVHYPSRILSYTK